MAARKKGGLGKGIDALITPSSKKGAEQEKIIVEKPVEKSREDCRKTGGKNSREDCGETGGKDC